MSNSPATDKLYQIKEILTKACHPQQTAPQMRLILKEARVLLNKAIKESQPLKVPPVKESEADEISVDWEEPTAEVELKAPDLEEKPQTFHKKGLYRKKLSFKS